MKSIFKIMTIVLALITFCKDSFPQEPDIMKRGIFYTFTLYNGAVIKGKVISYDSFYVLINTKNGINEIKRQNIINLKRADEEFLNEYFGTYKKPDYRSFLCLNLGYVIPESENHNTEYYYYSDPVVELNNGFSVSVDYTGFFSRYFGVRAGISYSVMKNKDYNYSNNSQNFYYQSSRTGGSLSQFIFGFNLLAGMFHPEKVINFYGLAGFGIGILNGSEVNNSNYYSSNSNPDYQFLLSYGIGGGLTFRLSEKIALMTEVNYDFISPEKGFYSFTKELGFKAGIIFINF